MYWVSALVVYNRVCEFASAGTTPSRRRTQGFLVWLKHGVYFRLPRIAYRSRKYDHTAPGHSPICCTLCQIARHLGSSRNAACSSSSISFAVMHPTLNFSHALGILSFLFSTLLSLVSCVTTMLPKTQA